MNTRATTAAAAALGLAGSVAIALSAGDPGDWTRQSAPAVLALADGRLGGFFDNQPVYGSLAALLQAPFAWLAIKLGGGGLATYRLATLPCLLAVAALGVTLARQMAARGRHPLACLAMPLLAVANPATIAAVGLGHPEELLAGALAIGAVLCVRQRPLTAAALLGLALATKQWTLLAAPALLLACPPRRRLLTACSALAVAAALLGPMALASPHRYAANARFVRGDTFNVSRFSVWWPFAASERRVFVDEHGTSAISLHRLPPTTTRVGRPIAVLAAIALALAAWIRRRRSTSDALALLAIALLLRCVLDPVDNQYYHVPLLLSLLAWEARRGAGLPLVTVLAATALWASFDHVLLVRPALDNAFYLIWTLSLGGALGVWLFGRRASQRAGVGARPAAVARRPLRARST